MEEMHDQSQERLSPDPPYYYRRRLGLREFITAAGVAIASGALGFYIARLFLQRTPLVPPDRPLLPKPETALKQERALSEGG
jgi:hypothetical protein